MAGGPAAELRDRLGGVDRSALGVAQGQEALELLRLLEGVRVLALEVLEGADLDGAGVVEVLDGGGDLGVAELLERAPAALAVDDLEALALRAQLDGLLQPVLLDRGRERGDLGVRVAVEGRRVDLVDEDAADGQGRALSGRRRLANGLLLLGRRRHQVLLRGFKAAPRRHA